MRFLEYRERERALSIYFLSAPTPHLWASILMIVDDPEPITGIFAIFLSYEASPW
jgi:hypothetical protein